MSPIGYASAVIFVLLIVSAWLFYLRHDIRRWFRERGPRRQMEREDAEKRQQEVDRLREELAAKYLAPGGKRPPPAGSA